MIPGARPRAWQAPVGLALVTVALFRDAVFAGRVFFERDIHMVWYPRVETMVRAVAEGAWPLWDSRTAFGLPALADPSYQIAYPLTWLNLVLLPATYYKVYVFIHCFAAGLGVCLLLRRWSVPPLASFLGGAFWSASGPLLSFVSTLHHFAGLAWIPWVLLALHVALVRPGLGAALLLGATAAGQVLAGSGDMCLITGIMGTAYATFVRFSLPEARTLGLGRLAVGALVAGATALLLAAAQWLPTAVNMAAGSRLRFSPETNTYWSLHPASLVDLLVAGLAARFPMTPSVRAVIFEGREPFLASLYIGVPVLTLAALGAVLTGPRLRVLALGGGMLLLLAALGRYTPAYRLLLSIPFFALLRYPTKYMIGVSLFVAVLAALGVMSWGRSWSAAERRRALGIGLAALAFSVGAVAAAELVRRGGLDLTRYAVAGSDLGATVSRLRWAALGSAAAGLLLLARIRDAAPVGWSRGMVAAIALTDAVVAGQGVNLLAPAELLTHRPPIVDYLRSTAPMTRVFSVPTSPAWLQGQLARGPVGWEPEWRWALGLQEMVSPPTSGRWGIGGSYDGELTGLGPPALSGWSIALMRAPDPLALTLLRLGNVGAVVHVREAAYRDLPPEAEFPSVFASPIRLSRVPDPLPWAYMVGGWREASDHDAPVLLVSADFDRTREVVLAPGRGPRPAPEDFAGIARLLWRRADALALETEATHPCLAVVVEGYHKDWKATVDGRPAEVLKANTLFRAVDVPAGRHTVEMRYRPGAAAWGAALSAAGLGLVVTLGIAAAGRRGRNCHPRAAPLA